MWRFFVLVNLKPCGKQKEHIIGSLQFRKVWGNIRKKVFLSVLCDMLLGEVEVSFKKKGIFSHYDLK